MKSYTDITQSKKLAEILPIESADMKFPYFGDGQYGSSAVFGEPIEFSGGKDVPCWSLAALLSVFSVPKLEKDEGEDGEVEWWVVSHYTDDYRYESDYRDEPIDACYNLILKIKEKDLL